MNVLMFVIYISIALVIALIGYTLHVLVTENRLSETNTRRARAVLRYIEIATLGWPIVIIGVILYFLLTGFAKAWKSLVLTIVDKK